MISKEFSKNKLHIELDLMALYLFAWFSQLWNFFSFFFFFEVLGLEPKVSYVIGKNFSAYIPRFTDTLVNCLLSR